MSTLIWMYQRDGIYSVRWRERTAGGTVARKRSFQTRDEAITFGQTVQRRLAADLDRQGDHG